jgi:cobalt-zinc-cadmium resistance protein CzcA
MAGRDDVTDVVNGIVLMQKFERTMEVVTRVREAVAEAQHRRHAAEGRADHAVLRSRRSRRDHREHVLHNMMFGIALIFLIQWLFLGNLRSAIIVAATIPVALFLAVIITVLRGRIGKPAFDRRHRSRHHRRLHGDHGGEHLPPLGAPHPARDHRPERSLTTSCRRVLAAAVEVDKAIFFSVIITIAAFLPLFTMQGVEGQIFGPMARTYAYALTGAVIATFTVTPVMASILLPEKVQEIETILVRFIRNIYLTLLPMAVKNARIAATFAAAFLIVVGALGARLGTEFLPKLEEGNLWIRAVMPPTITLEAGMEAVAAIRKTIMEFAPVQTVASEQGRGDDATDPDGSFLAEFFVPLKPQGEWPKGLSKVQLVDEMNEKLNAQFIGNRFQLLAIIQDNHRGGGVRREG